jgi:hypothetical protein
MLKLLEGKMQTEQEVWISYCEKYEVSSFGNVRNAKTHKLYKQHVSNGYKRISLSMNDGRNKKVFIHRLVARCFHGEPATNDLVVNHKNGDRFDNRAENLEFCTHQENSAHARREGLHKPRIRSVTQYSMVGEEIAVYESIKKAEELTGISNKHISSVCRGKRKSTGGYKWRYTDDDFIPIDSATINGVPIVGFPNYILQRDGKIFSRRANAYLQPVLRKNGFYSVKLCNNGVQKDATVRTLVRTHYPSESEADDTNS